MIARIASLSFLFALSSLQQAGAQSPTFELLNVQNASATEGAAIFSTLPESSGDFRKITLLIVLRRPQLDSMASYVTTPLKIDCSTGSFRFLAKPSAYDVRDQLLSISTAPPDFDLVTPRSIDTSGVDTSEPMPTAFQYVCRSKPPLKRFNSLADALSFERLPK